MIRVVIAEDHQALIDGIKLYLKAEPDIQVIGEANDGEQLIHLVQILKPHVVITDIRMPRCDGITATRKIKKNFPNIQVIAFSMFDQDEAINQMKDAGASGYILKNSSLTTLVTAIRTVVKNETFFDNEISGDKLSPKKEDTLLSNRETEILKLIGEGKTSIEISEILGIGKTTVDSHRKNILRKLNIQGKPDLLRFALERKYDFD